MVGQRRHEVSVRMALGATGGAIVRMLVRDSLRPVVAGVVCGLGVAALAGRAIEGFLFGVAGHDPAALGAAVLVLLLAAAAAVLFPARRPARTDPAEMLRRG